jgi:protein-arginine kinase activator protein McsA
MEIRVMCEHKGCRKEMAPVVDKKTLEAYCTECSQKMNSITVFMRRQMADFGQIKQEVSKKLPWSVKCPFCNKEAPPIQVEGNNLGCSICKKTFSHLSQPFIAMIKENLKISK